VLWAYRGSGDLRGPWKRGTDTSTHTRLVQGNAGHLKEMLAAKLDIATPGPGFIHFPSNPEAGFDEEFFRQLLSERRERRMRNGVLSVRWVQTRERNEALDLVCMILCCVLTYRGAIDTMESQTVGAGDTSAPRATVATSPPSRTKPESAFGAQAGAPGIPLPSGWGVQSRITPEQKAGKRSWGVQPSVGNIWDL
jgi:phage terminase large subunit GpA-like protein